MKCLTGMDSKPGVSVLMVSNSLGAGVCRVYYQNITVKRAVCALNPRNVCQQSILADMWYDIMYSRK